MKIDISYSSEVEAQVLLLAIVNWEQGTLRKLNMHILPYDAASRCHPYGIVVPKLDYSNLPNLMQDLKKSRSYKPGKGFLTYTPYHLADVIELVKATCGNDIAWQIDESLLVKLLTDICADFTAIFGTQPIKKLTIYKVRFGTGTVNSPLKTLANNVEIAVREGAGIANVVAALLDSLSHLHTAELKLEANELRPIRDWLLYNTRIATTLKNYNLSFVPSTTYMRKKSTNSQNRLDLPYVKSLNLFTDINSFEVKGNEVFFNNKSLDGLTGNEKSLLVCLISKKNKTVSYDELLDILEQKDREVSYYAVYKAIERLRKRLNEYGVPSNTLKTIPRKGVMLITG